MEHKNRLGCRLQIRKIGEFFAFSSLFSRLVVVYISMLTIVLIILFITFTNTFRSYFVQHTQDMMIKQAQSIAAEYQRLVNSKEDEEMILYRIMMMQEYMEASAWLVERNGSIYGFSKEGIMPMNISNAINTQNIQKVYEGNIVRIDNGFREYFLTPVLTVGYPIEVNGKIISALFIHTPMPVILETIDEVCNITFHAVALVGTCLFVWIYVISKRITNPIKEMNTVAKTIASGQFDKRIEIKGKDEIAQLSNSFNHMAEELDKIEENRNRFIANISHDLRSPLTSIQGFITAILDGTIQPDKQEKYLKIVLAESKRMINMTNKILDLSRLEEGREPIEKVPININWMIETVVLTMENRAKEKDVKISMHLDSKHYTILGDMDGLSRVLQNLLDNAFKFVNEHGEIYIKTTYRYNKIWVDISNSGPVIPKDQQAMIWNRFYKGDHSRGQDKRGVGLGLVIVKEILKQHGEEIGIKTNEYNMVTFYFSLTPQKEGYET